MVKLPIYLDNNSTTPLDPRVLEAIMPYFTDIFGNAASKSHEFGWKAEAAVESSRTKIAKLVSSEFKEIIFTSGATESVNLALKGASEAYGSKGNKIITSPAEHKAALDTYKTLQKRGFIVEYLKVDKYGLIDLNELGDSIDEKTIMVSIMFANNEIGTIQPINEIGKLCREKGVLFHTDAAQALGKIEINVNEMNIDLMSLSSHKLYGPKGIGALYVRSKSPAVKLVPQIDGGGHERGFRSGTLNVPAIAGFGKACEIALKEMKEEVLRLNKLRIKLHDGIRGGLEGVQLNGHPEKRLPGNLNLSFEYVNSDALMMAIKEIAVSSGSACSSAEVGPSHVLKAIGASDEVLHSSIRFGIGRFNSEEEIEYAAAKVIEKVTELRNISPAYKMGKNQAENKIIGEQIH
jgi:cysteine desulfurase